MRISNALDRLNAAVPALLSETEALVSPGEEERILERILGSSRPNAAPHGSAARRRRFRIAAAVALVVVAAIASVALADHGNRRSVSARTGPGSQAHPSHATFRLAGYRFRLPAGFKASSRSVCQFWLPVSHGGLQSWRTAPMTVLNSFSAAASAAGGCIQALVLAGNSVVPPSADRVSVGSYSGFLVSGASSHEDLYVEIPTTQGNRYLALLAQGLTSDQLVAIARSGLPGSSG